MPAVPSSRTALEVLATIGIANERGAGYDRDSFGYPADTDGDGCNTRAEVLIRDSMTPAQVDPFDPEDVYRVFLEGEQGFEIVEIELEGVA